MFPFFAIPTKKKKKINQKWSRESSMVLKKGGGGITEINLNLAQTLLADNISIVTHSFMNNNKKWLTHYFISQQKG